MDERDTTISNFNSCRRMDFTWPPSSLLLVIQYWVSEVAIIFGSHKDKRESVFRPTQTVSQIFWSKCRTRVMSSRDEGMLLVLTHAAGNDSSICHDRILRLADVLKSLTVSPKPCVRCV